MAKRSKKVAFYLRVPTRHQDAPAGSLTSQKQRLFEWFKYHNSQAKFADIMDSFFFDVGIMEWPDASPFEDNGTPATIVLAKDVREWQDTEIRACPECKEISMKGFEPKE